MQAVSPVVLFGMVNLSRLAAASLLVGNLTLDTSKVGTSFWAHVSWKIQKSCIVKCVLLPMMSKELSLQAP